MSRPRIASTIASSGGVFGGGRENVANMTGGVAGSGPAWLSFGGEPAGTKRDATYARTSRDGSWASRRTVSANGAGRDDGSK